MSGAGRRASSFVRGAHVGWSMVVLACLVLSGAPRAQGGDEDDPGPGDWAEGAEYRALGRHPDVPDLFGYEKVDWEKQEDGDVAGAWLWIARAEGQPEVAYSVGADVGEGGSTSFVVLASEKAAEATAPGEAPEPVHVASGSADTAEGREGAVRALIRDVAVAAPDWAKATTAEGPAGKDDLETERLRWRTLARALEGVHAAHPKHLGIDRDLVTAYTRLFLLEGASPTASTLALLIPRTLDDWAAASEGDRTADDVAVDRRARAALYLRTGPHALAWDAATEDPEDADLARVKAILDSLGYESFEALDAQDVETGLGTVRVDGWRAGGQPAVPGVFFERLAFRVTPAQDDARPFETSFVLAGRPAGDESGSVRWALYGVLGTSRRLLRLYGATEPEADAVREAVRAEVVRSLATEKPR